MILAKLFPSFSLRYASGLGVVAFVILAGGFRPSTSFGQTPKFFEDLVVSDDVIHDFVAIANTEGLFANHSKKFGVPLAIKKSSLQSRLQQISNAADEYQKRWNILKHEQQKLQDGFLATVESSRAKSLAIPVSRAAAEQLLTAAQLELQKVSWDLAAEMALLENEDAARSTAKSEEEEQEEYLLAVESEKLKSQLFQAENVVASMKDLVGETITNREAAEMRSTLENARLRYVEHQAKVQFARAKRRSAESSLQAESKQQALKLTAKKKQIERYINELIEAMPSVMQNENLSVLATRHEASMASLSKIVDEMETKKQEIEGLLSIIDSVKPNEKAEQVEKKD